MVGTKVSAQQNTALLGYQYYKFVQYYDSARVTFLLGEITFKSDSGVTARLKLKNWDPFVNRPKYDNSLAGLTNSSGTATYLRYHPGDTLEYFPLLLANNDFTRSSGYVGVRDTIIWYIDIVKWSTNELIATIDSIGVLPHDSAWQLSTHYISSEDTSFVKKYVIPSGWDCADSIDIRIRNVFKGDNNRLSISRWDEFSQNRLSEVYKSYAYSIAIPTITTTLDSLDALRKLSQNDMYKEFSFDVKTSHKSNLLTLIIDAKIAQDVTDIIILDAQGRVIQTVHPMSGSDVVNPIDISALNSGIYYVKCKTAHYSKVFLSKFLVVR